MIYIKKFIVLLTSGILLSIPHIPYPCSSLSLCPSYPIKAIIIVSFFVYKHCNVTSKMMMYLKNFCLILISFLLVSSSSQSHFTRDWIFTIYNSNVLLFKYKIIDFAILFFLMLIIRTSSLNWSWYISTSKTQLMLQREINVVKLNARSSLYFCRFWWHH